MTVTTAPAPRSLLSKLMRYSVASVVGVTLGQSCLYLFDEVVGLEEFVANILAVAISSIPVYLINRYWAWELRDRNSLRREVVPFWGMTFLGLVLSTLAVAVVDGRTDWQPAIQAANLAGFGVLWVAKFMVLDRVVFARPDPLEPPPIL